MAQTISELKKHFSSAYPNLDADRNPADFAAYLFLQQQAQIDRAVSRLVQLPIGTPIKKDQLQEIIRMLKPPL